MKLIIILYILFIYLNLFQFSNGDVQLIDVSFDINAHVGYTNDKGICEFANVYILLYSTIQSNSATMSLVGNPTSGNFSKNQRLQNETSTLYQVNYMVTKGSFQVPIIGSYENAEQTSQITFTCIEVLRSDIELDSNEAAVSVNVFGTIGFFVKLKNLQYPFQDKQMGSTNGNNNYMGNSIYYFTQNAALTLSDDSLISFFSGTMLVHPNNYYLDNNNEDIYDYHLYTNSNQVQLMGDLVAPAFTFVTNSTYYKPPFLIELPSGSLLYNMRLISTNGQLKTYLGYYDYRDYSGVSAGFKLKSQSNSSYVQRKSETLTVTDITFNPIPRDGFFTYFNNGVRVIQFSSLLPYYFSPIYVRYRGTKILQFPFGFVGSNTKGYTWSPSMRMPLSAPSDQKLYVETDTTIEHYNDNNTGFNVTLVSPTNPSVPLQPIFNDYQFLHLYDFMYILKINITSFIPIFKIQINEMVFNYAESISIQSQFNEGGIFEFPLNLIVPRVFITVNDYSTGVSGGYYSLEYLTSFTLPSFYDDKFNYLDIKNASLLQQVVDVTNTKVGNILYFNYVGLNSNTPIGLLLNGRSFSNEISPVTLEGYSFDKLWPAKYNSTIGMFQVEFWLPKNSQPGKIPFALFFKTNLWVPNSVMGDAAQLTVISNNADLYGPIFTKIEKFPLLNPSIQDTSVIGWNLTISDPINGFKNGTIRVRGTVDGSTYNFNIVENSITSIFSFIYTVQVNVVSPCASQDYIITDVLLYDTEDNNSTFSIYSFHKSIEQSSLYNPFINYMNDSNINRISVVCGSVSDDSSPPTVTSISTGVDTLDVSSAKNRGLNITYQVEDTGTGLKIDHHPTVYLSALNFDTIECIPDKIIVIDTFSNKYNCSVTVPLGFGYPYGIIFSVFGLVNNGGYYGGYSSADLEIVNLFNNISTTMTMDLPFIKGSSKLSTDGGKLWIYGKGFKYVTSATIIVRALSITHTLGIDAVVGYSGVLVTVPKIDSPFVITLIGGASDSNEFTIIPYKPVSLYPETPTPSVTQTPSSSPTNKPQKCLGNPECGGPNQGYCNGQTGCICKSPWIGVDCSSKVIIVSPPITNPSNPSTEIPIIDDNGSNNNDTSNYLFKSLISIVSLREFDFQNNIIKNYTFDKWILTPIDELTSNYFTSITVTSKVDGTSSISNITVKLQWFKQQTNITFANEQLIMQPSSMKYTIELSSYQFESSLNTLQFVMMASLQSKQTSNICSKSEFGETSSGDNSNYVKIQIDNKSLYGRFIKRAIVDSAISSINNTPLDSSFNAIKESSTLQSYIGINIPNFKSSITIDPDFSVLLDSNKPLNNDNDSICNISKSGLTKSQLAGIIVGAGVIFIAIVGVALFIFIRNRKHTLLLLRVKDIKMFKSK